MKPTKNDIERIADLNEIVTHEASGIFYISPKFAAKIIKKLNIFNRDLRPNTQKSRLIAQSIEDGNFYTSTIQFDTNGNLIDGQHRLNAVSMQNRKVKFNVVFGQPRDCIYVTDTGNARSLNDHLTLKLYKTEWPELNKSYRSRATRFGQFWQDLISGSKLIDVTSRFNFFTKNKDSITWAAKYAPKNYNRKAFLGALAMLHSIDASKAQNFAFEVEHGYSYPNVRKISKYAPATWVRKFLDECEGGSGSSSIYEGKRVVYAMQRYLDGKKMLNGFPKVIKTTELKG